MVNIYSWNVNGIRAVYNKGFMEWLKAADPDILCLQETKAHPDQLPPELRYPEGYHAYWSSAEKKGYSGVALFSKKEPKAVKLGLGIHEYDSEGRTVIAEYDDFVVIGAYFPNGGRDLSRVPFKMQYKAAFLQYCNQLCSEGKPVIFCGDVNTAHQDIDLARPKQNQKTTGFLPEERVWINEVVNQGYLDIYRTLNPELEGAYTWWSNMPGARDKNIGWRIDYFFISPDLRDRVVTAEIHPTILGSDHCPISLTLK